MHYEWNKKLALFLLIFIFFLLGCGESPGGKAGVPEDKPDTSNPEIPDNGDASPSDTPYPDTPDNETGSSSDTPDNGGVIPSGVGYDDSHGQPAVFCPPGESVITVGCGGDFGTIQAAINAAPSGATIEVCEGTYPEQLRINKTLNIHGTGAVIIDGVDTPYCEPFIKIWGETHVCFDGIQFTRGGVMRVENGREDMVLSILNSSFYDNQISGCNEFALIDAWNAGRGAVVNLSHTVFENNEGQIGAFLVGEVVMSDVVVRNNTAEHIIMNATDSSLIIENSLFEGNTVNAGCFLCLQEDGGETSDTEINGSSFIGNSGLRTSAIYMLWGAAATVTDSLFSGNTARHEATDYTATVGMVFDEGDGTSFESVNTVWESNVPHEVFMQQSGGTFWYNYDANGVTDFLCSADTQLCNPLIMQLRKE